LSGWRFRSPVSYWHPDHYGGLFGVVEIILGLVLAIILWRRFQVYWVRGLMALAILAYLGPPLYFGLLTNI
jgi:hypothetical protein